MVSSLCSPCLSDVSHVWLVQCTLDGCSSAVPLPGCSQVNLQVTEQAGTEYSYGWDIFPAAPFTWIRRILMAVAGETICTDIFEVRGYQVIFEVAYGA